MKIGGRDLESSVLVVAEIGNNHEGDPEAARELVRAAAASGADAVKLQTYRTELFVRPADTERYARMQRFELSPDVVRELAALARSLGLGFVSTPLDLESVELLAPLVDALKVASGDNDFWPLLDAVGTAGVPVIVSSGMSELDGVAAAVARVRAAGAADVAVLQCTSSYPAPPGEANLAAIPLLRDQLGCTVGYSDHTLGLEVALAAVAAGARIVEKHFTLDKARSDFRDHQLSADPAELAELVEGVRRLETLLGAPQKTIAASERETAYAARRSAVAAHDLRAGHTVGPEDIAWLRPRDGLAPGEETRLLGRRLVRDVAGGEALRVEDVS